MQHAQRQSLIGREGELEQLEGGLADARAGRGSLFLVTGVAGIGKTRLAEVLSERADADGMLTVWGRCWENPGAPPYWPWAQALRAVIDARDATTLEAELGGGADWIAEIVPELRERVTGIGPLGSLRSEQARFALFDAVSTFLRNVSATDPVLMLLDDLHAADRESLAMLDFVVRSLSRSPVMLFGAYQEAAVKARPEVEKLFGALGVKSRHVALGGIDEGDVGLIVEEETGTPPPPELVREAMPRRRATRSSQARWRVCLQRRGSSRPGPGEMEAACRCRTPCGRPSRAGSSRSESRVSRCSRQLP